jgi:hypothetical protein
MTGSRQRCGERDGEEDETAPKPKLRTGREQHRAGRESATMTGEPESAKFSEFAHLSSGSNWPVVWIS